MGFRTIYGSLRTQYSRCPRLRSQPVRGITQLAQEPVKNENDELFRYTSGRWIYNEKLRLAERYLKFDLSALLDVAAKAVGRSSSDIVSFFKLSEGGFNRVFQANFEDGGSVLARLPYPSTVPKHYTVASEAATLDFLRLKGIPTPEVHAYCATQRNPVGAEYIIMEKLEGTPLGDTWYTMTPKEQHSIMKQIVEWESRLMSLEFPASGSIYYPKDLVSEKTVPLPDKDGVAFCIGPIAHYGWWHEERSNLSIDRGPWALSSDIFRAVGERELAWTKAYAKPRLQYERLYREIHGFRQSLPDEHIKNLCDYLRLALCLGFKPGTSLNRPAIRHPDFQPNNIHVSESNEIVGLIDWQHSSVLPLGLEAGIPKHFQNYGDPVSDKMMQPQLGLPSDYDSMSPSEQASTRETTRKRLVHFFYAALTKRSNEEHYDAIFDDSTISHQRLFKSAGTPWEGDSITLQADMIRAIQDWPTLISADSAAGENGVCSAPFTYPDATVETVLDLDVQQKEADTAMEQMGNALGVVVVGWVSNDEYNTAKETASEMKAQMLAAAETQDEMTGVKDHFPFDDFDESA